MEDKELVGVTIATLIILASLSLLSFGIIMTTSTIGHDYTGLGNFFGLVIILVGAVFVLCCLISSFYYFKLSSKIIKIFIVFIIVAIGLSSYIGIKKNMALQRERDLYYQKEQPK